MRRLYSRLAAVALIAGFAAGGRGSADPVPEGDLAKVQGKWTTLTRDRAGHVIKTTKTIKAQKETITVTDENDNVVYAHQDDFELEVSGKARVFKYSNCKVTEGPNKGREFPGGSYLYRVTEKEFVEVHGLLAGEEDTPVNIVLWTKVAKP